MYHLSKRIEAADFDEVVEDTRAALSAQGFGVLTEIDVKATLKDRLDEDMDQYLILGACNPKMAHRAIGAAPEIGVLLPCNVVVREEGGDVIIDAMDPASVMAVVNKPGVTTIADEVRTLLENAVSAVG